MGDLTIGQLAERTEVAPATLRMWEQRYSFPAPQRLPSGHRRYSEADVERVHRVLRERAAGLSMEAAVARVLAADTDPARSIFAALRRRRASEPHLIEKRALVAMARAIEDEALASGERFLLIGSFQHERFYRQSEDRWRALADRAQMAVVFADFDRERELRGGPLELPVDRRHPLAREWTIICRGGRFAAALSGWERPGPPGAARRFETLWSVESDFVDGAARVAADLAAERSPQTAERIGELLDRPSESVASMARTLSLTNRMVAYVAALAHA